MPSYQERSRLIKQLSEQAYFDALKKDASQKKDVRVGGVDGRTGRYQVLSADGGLSSNGVPTSNAAPPSDGFVRGLRSENSNAIALGYRDYVRTAFVNRIEDATPPIGIGRLLSYEFILAETGVGETSFSVGVLVNVEENEDIDIVKRLFNAPPDIDPDLCTANAFVDELSLSVTLELNTSFTLRPALGEDNVNFVRCSVRLSVPYDEFVLLLPEIEDTGFEIFIDTFDPSNVTTSVDVDSSLGFNFSFNGLSSNRYGYFGLATVVSSTEVIVILSDYIPNPPSGESIYIVDIERY